MNSALAAILEDRLTASTGPAAPVVDLVLAACSGPDDLASALAGRAVALRERDGPSAPAPSVVHLRALEVTAFRGIGPTCRLDLTPGAGLTLVVGRNGSGKSSLAEALEFLLTRVYRRAEGRSTVWLEDWRNIHDGGPTRIVGTFAVEGRSAPVTVTHAWPAGGTLYQGETSVSAGLSLGWEAALAAYRPFLPYAELDAMFDQGPTVLHDALARILGLGDLEEGRKALAAERLLRERALRSSTEELGPLLSRLDACDDPRAGPCRAALSGSPWALDGLERILSGTDDGRDRLDASIVLPALAGIGVPDADAVESVAARLETARTEAGRQSATDAGRALQMAGLLESALAVHGGHGGEDCPVCRTPGALGGSWEADTRREVGRLRAEAAEAEAARREAAAAEDAARLLLAPPPSCLERAAEAGIDAEALRRAWAAWTSAPASADDLVRHLRQALGPLRAEAEAVRAAASAEQGRREDAWRPVARELGAWLSGAREASGGVPAVKLLKAAEAWLRGATDEIRSARFAPIADAVRHNWDLLRQQSSVALDQLDLVGSGHMRRVALDVTIDGVEGAALGVMSQGELNSLALSLFLPRASLPESPFRFVVIDDPVQSMDPAKVDGLARLLAETARRRQVVVFTHDDRLTEAVGRQRIAARVVEVVRRTRSAVEIRERSTPALQLLEDARTVARAVAMSPEVRGSIVPGLCRQAVEAACAQAARRRRIGRGEPHAEIEALLDGLTTLKTRVALALLDDPERSGDVLSTLNSRFGRWAGDVLQRMDKGSHAGDSGDLTTLVDGAGRLATAVADAA